MCPVRILEVDVGSPRPINRWQSELMVMRMGKWSLAGEEEIDQSDSTAMSLEAKLVSVEVYRPFVGSRVASLSQWKV